MVIYWKAWTNASSEKSTRVLATRLLRMLDCSATELSFAPYPKTAGWMFAFQTATRSATWNDAVVETIALGQRVAHEWRLSGDVLQDPEGWSATVRVSGVSHLQWQLVASGQDQLAPRYPRS